MSPKAVLLTAVVTVVAVVAAIVAVVSRPTPSVVTLDAEPAFAALRGRPEVVATIHITGAGGPVTLVRSAAGGWTVSEKAGYPAKTDAVRTLILGLSDLRLVEPKTARPDRYARLQVEDVAADGSASRRVRMVDENGDVLADAIIGRRVFSATGGRDAGTYVRRGTEDQAWLASGGITVDTEAVDWLAPDVIDIEPAAVRQVAVTPADGPSFTASRDDAESPLTLTQVPDGRQVRAAAVERLARMLEGVTLADVAEAGSIGTGAEPVAAVIVETFDDRVIRVDLETAGSERWATVSVTGGDSAAIAARVEGWSYRLAAGVADRMAPMLEDLLEPAEPTGGS